MKKFKLALFFHKIEINNNKIIKNNNNFYILFLLLEPIQITKTMIFEKYSF
jgi:hypothetical protein